MSRNVAGLCYFRTSWKVSNRMGNMNTPLDTALAELDATLTKSNEIIDAVNPLLRASAIMSEYAEQLAEAKDWDKLGQVMETIAYLMELATKKMPSASE